jgi:hypothetical protein
MLGSKSSNRRGWNAEVALTGTVTAMAAVSLPCDQLDNICPSGIFAPILHQKASIRFLFCSLTFNMLERERQAKPATYKQINDLQLRGAKNCKSVYSGSIPDEASN